MNEAPAKLALGWGVWSACVLSVACCNAAQSSGEASSEAFEVVSVKPTGSAKLVLTPNSGRVTFGSPTRLSGRRFTCEQPLLTVLEHAFSMKYWQIVGPSWLGAEMYSIEAIMPEGAPPQKLGPMLQTMLAGRFGLKFHRDTKEMPVFALKVGAKGLKLKPIIPKPDSYSQSMSRGHLSAKGMQLPAFAGFLSQAAGRPVIDMTGVTDAFDIELRWPADKDDFGGKAIAIAIDEQLGLKLVAQKLPVEIIVIDHLEKIPTPN